MLNNIQYSIIKHLEAAVPEAQDVVWHYDGVNLSNKPKPFILVEDVQTDIFSMEASRNDYREEYHLQIGIFGNSEFERNQITESVKQALQADDIPLYDTRQTTPVVIGAFFMQIDRVTPMNQLNVEDDTLKHRAYLDVTVVIYRARNGAFTQ